MKKLLLLLVVCAVQNCITVHAASVYHIETEYTPQNGYRYWFDKMDPQTGSSVRITQLPVNGFFTGYAFFNCFGHYVFQGIDTTTSNGNYINKLYELDTLGNLIRTLPMDTATGTWYKMCVPAAGSPYYFALRWNINTGQYQMEKINAINGSRTIQALPALSAYSFNNSDFTITRNDVIWMGMGDQMTGMEVLLSFTTASNTLAFHDTLNTGYYYNGLNYNCSTDTVYGFISHGDSIQGAELFKVHGSSSTVIHSGRTATGAGMFTAGTHTRLNDGSFYIKGSAQSYLLPDFNITGPMFTLPVVPSSSLPVFCFAAPRESCIHYTPCEETSGAAEYHRESFAVFPNPVTDGVLHVQQPGVFAYELADISGRLVLSGNATNAVSIPVHTLASGVYVVRIAADETIDSRKIIIGN